MAQYLIGKHMAVMEGTDGDIFVTRPSIISNTISTVRMRADAKKVAEWLLNRKKIGGISNDMVQNVFPDLTDAEREFLMTGITEEEWNRTFPKGDE